MRLKLLAAAVMGVAITAPACALAGQIIETATSTASGPDSYSLAVAAFNTSLGTLKSVTFELINTTTASVGVYNATGTSLTFNNAFASLPLTVTGPAGFSLSDTATAILASGTAAPGLNIFSGVTGVNSTSETFTSGLSAFEGSHLNLSYLADVGNGTYGGTSVSGLYFGGSGVAVPTFEVIYNYTAAAVPEPATWAFLMLGVGAIGVAMRRRQAGLALAAA